MTPASRTLARVLRGDLCTGCGLCAGLAPQAIAMEASPSGFARPRQAAPIDEQTEAAIDQACPGSVVAPWTGDGNVHPYWGPSLQCMTGFSTNDELRFRGSSGGVVSALALHAISSGVADKVLHVDADPERPTGNVMTWSRDAAGIAGGAGSRYASSSPLAEIDKALSENVPFVFIGKPCDVSALRQLARLDDRVTRLVPLMLSFFCAGIPSSRAADRVIDAMGLPPAEVVNFRYRGEGWPGLTVAETASGKRGEMTYAQSWGAFLSADVQNRCKICPDGVGGVADIVCADAWYGGESGYPAFEERDGRSLIIARTALGASILTSAIEAKAIEASPAALDEIDAMQPGQVRKKRVLSARLAAFRLALQPIPRMKGLQVLDAARFASWREILTNFLGSCRRIYRRVLTR